MGSTRGGAGATEVSTHPSEDGVSSDGVPMLKLVGSILAASRSTYREEEEKRMRRRCGSNTHYYYYYYPKVPKSCPQERRMLLLRYAALRQVFNR